MNAVARRYDAITVLCDATRAYDPTVKATVWFKTWEDRNELAADIYSLRSLGRTERWQNSVTAWMTMVASSTPENFQWAFDQYGIWASYAAE